MPQPDVVLHLAAADYLPATFPLGIRIVEQQPEYPLHTHDFTEIVVVTQGYGTHDLPRQTYTITAGDVFVIPRGQAHRFRDTRALSVINVMFHTSILIPSPAAYAAVPGYHALFVIEPHLRARGHGHGYLRLTTEQLICLQRWLDELTTELTVQASGYLLLVQSLLTRIIVMLARWYHALSARTAQPVLVLGQLHQYLLDHLSESLTIPQIADHLCCSPRTLQRNCHTLLGQSPQHYLTTLRLQEAVHLLCESELSIAEIADRVGYADTAYFSRQFHTAYGSSPRTFRRESHTESDITTANRSFSHGTQQTSAI